MSDPTPEIVALLADSANAERLSEVTEQLTEFYKEPAALPILFNIIQNVPEVQNRAIIGYKSCIRQTWNYYFCAVNEGGELIRGEEREQVKLAIAELIPCLPLQNAKMFIDYSKPVFKTDAANWESLFVMLNAMTDTQEHILVGSYLISSIMCRLDAIPDFRVESLPIFVQFGQSAIGIGSEEAVVIGAGTLGVAISYTPPELIGEMQEVFGQLLEILPVALKAPNDDVSCQVATAVADACQADALPMPAGDVMSFLIACLSDPEVPPDHYKDIFIIVNQLVGWHADELSEATADILMLIMQAIERVDIDDPNCLLVYNDNAKCIAETAEFLAGNVEDVNFFKVLKSLDDPEGPLSRQFAYLLVFTMSIDEFHDDVIEHMSWVCQFLIRNVQMPVPKIRELALLNIRDVIAKILNDDQVDLATHLFENVVQCFPDPNPEMCTACLETMVDLLNGTTIRSSVIEAVLTLCKDILDNGEVAMIHPHAFEVISSLIFAVEDDIIPYAETVFPLIWSGAVIDASSPDAAMIKQRAITALGNIIRFATAPLAGVLPQSVQLIFENCMSDDPNIKNDSVLALINLVFAKCELLMEGKDAILEIIGSYFNNPLFSAELEDKDGKDGVVANPACVIGMQNIMGLIKVIFKYYNALAPGDLESFGKWVEIFQTFMGFPNDDFQRTAISAGLYCCLTMKDLLAVTSEEQFGVWIVEYINMLCEIIRNTQSTVITNKCFRYFRILIENELTNEDQIGLAVEAALAAIDGKLPCQTNSDDLGSSSSDYVYKLLSFVYSKFPQICPIDDLLNHGKKLMAREERYFELSHYVSLLEHCYVHSDAMGNILKNKLIRTLMDAFQKYTSLFEEDNDGTAFCSYPSPISALRTVTERDPAHKSVQQFIGPVLEFLGVIMQAPYNGETYYYATMTNAVAFLCSLINLSPDDFDYPTWLPLMVMHLPLKSDEKIYAEKIYSTLLNVIVSKGFFDLDMDIFKCLARTMGLKDRFLNQNYVLTEETSAALLQIVGEMATRLPPEAIQACFDDQQSFERFQARLSG